MDFVLPAEVKVFEVEVDEGVQWRQVKQEPRFSDLNDFPDTLSKVGVKKKKPRGSTVKAARRAVASAVSLATLLGLPVCGVAAYASRLIVDTGCGKDMVSRHSFTPEFIEDHAYDRSRPLMMQTANGTVELGQELNYKIKKLQQTTSAVIGEDTPDLLSVGYRCMEQGFGFHWDPFSSPYLVLPDGKTEVDLCVDNYVPYLIDDGDISVHSGTCAAPFVAENDPSRARTIARTKPPQKGQSRTLNLRKCVVRKFPPTGLGPVMAHMRLWCASFSTSPTHRKLHNLTLLTLKSPRFPL